MQKNIMKSVISLLFFLLSAVSVNAQKEDLYSVILKGDWFTDKPGLEVMLHIDEKNKRGFTVAESNEVEQMYGIVGQMKPVKGKRNTYTFTAQDNFNGFDFIFRGTITFIRQAGGKIKMSIKCADPESGYDLPHTIILHKATAKEKKEKERRMKAMEETL